MTVSSAKAGSPFSLSNKVGRFGWSITWTLLFRPSPRPCHAWRRLLLRLWGARIADGVHVYPSARIWAPWNLSMGSRSCLGDHVDCYCQDRIDIGPMAVISQRAFLCCGSHDYTEPSLPHTSRPITIGEMAWVCAQATIGPGVTVGTGCVIGTGSVAMKDTPAWMICAGNPCRAIKPRKLQTPPAHIPPEQSQELA